MLQILENIKTYGLEILGLLYGFYRSKVKDNIDKGFMGRILVVIEDLVYAGGKLKQRYKGKANIKVEDNIKHTAMPISPFAGKKYGFYFPPEVDDDVYVVFPLGQGGTPSYIGSPWKLGDIPDEFKNSDGTVTKRGIKTKAGHFIRFEDSDKGENEKGILIKSSSGHTANLSDKGKKISIRSAGGLLVELDDENDKITITTRAAKIVIDNKADKVFLYNDSGAAPFVKGVDLFNYLLRHRHIGRHGMTSPPTPAPTPSILSQKIFGE